MSTGWGSSQRGVQGVQTPDAPAITWSAVWLQAITQLLSGRRDGCSLESGGRGKMAGVQRLSEVMLQPTYCAGL